VGRAGLVGRVGVVAAAMNLYSLGPHDSPDLLALPAPVSLPAQEPSFRGDSSELVVLPVVVTDKQNRYISDLTRDRFVIFDNGRKVPVELFSNEDAPATIGLILDSSSSMRHKLGEVLAASLAFAKTSNPQDELFALRFNDDVRDAVADRRFLLADDLVALQRAIASLRAEGRTSLYDALIAGLDHLRDGTRARKALVVVSDGGDNASQATLEHVLARARDSNAAIYTVGIYEEGDMDKNPGVLKSLARTTGGERFLPRSPGELMQACERIAREIRSGYTLGYVPPDRDGAYHRVRVEIVPADARRLSIRTRPGYFAAGRPSQP